MFFSFLKAAVKLVHQRDLLLQSYISNNLPTCTVALTLNKAPTSSEGRAELTCDKGIRSRLFFPPRWHEHGNIFVASFQKPIYCQFDSSTGKDFFVPMAETHIKFPYYMTLLFSECTQHTVKHTSPTQCHVIHVLQGF